MRHQIIERQKQGQKPEDEEYTGKNHLLDPGGSDLLRNWRELIFNKADAACVHGEAEVLTTAQRHIENRQRRLCTVGKDPKRDGNRIDIALGGAVGMDSLLPPRPKGMWRRTYERKLAEIIEADDRADRAFWDYVDRRWGCRGGAELFE